MKEGADMTRKGLILGSALALSLVTTTAAENTDNAGLDLTNDGLTLGDLIQGLAAGTFTLNDIRREGLLVFTTPFRKSDGFGDGPFDPSETPALAFGHRPTLQGNGLTLRVNGLDSQSCNECDSIVSHRTRPPTLGIAGVGGLVQNAIILPSLIDVADSDDDRVQFMPGHDPQLPLEFDGVADYNGRLANPPFLFGGGGVEMLAKEMTADLQVFLNQARKSPAGTVVSLDTHGVNFGSIASLGDEEVDLSGVEGIGWADNSGREPEEVLVVRPFGRKGENFSMRDFDRGAMQFHFGIQPVEVVGEDVDEDGDGVVNEVTIAEMTALHIFDVTNPRPFVRELDREARRGFQAFRRMGCASCHRPVMTTNSRFLPLAFPEVAHHPFENVYQEIDLVEVGFKPMPEGQGVFVPLFADLKRHDMGPGLAETFEQGEIPNEDFITARLWGVADTAPYLHDGRATTLFEAIEAHGGEAQPARDAFLSLSESRQAALIKFLRSLRTPNHPNQDLVNGHHQLRRQVKCPKRRSNLGSGLDMVVPPCQRLNLTVTWGGLTTSLAGDLRNQFTVDIRESLVAPVEKVGQRGVIHPQHMEYGGVDVMIGHDLFGGFVAHLIRRANDLPARDSPTGHPQRHGPRIVIATHAAL